MRLKPLTLQTDELWQLAGLDCQMFLTHLTALTTKEPFSLVKELTIKDGKLYQYPVSAVKELRASEEVFSNRTQTNNTYELELNLEANTPKRDCLAR